MAVKRIVVLANSIKRGGRCVAGRVLNAEGAGGAGEWVRPISSLPDGALHPQHMRVEGGGVVGVLDVIEVPVVKSAGDRVHPEDWVVDERASWKRVGRWPGGKVAGLEESPRDLWMDGSERTDRVWPDSLRRWWGHKSLYLIRPVNLRLEMSRVAGQSAGEFRRRTRALFEYNDERYALNLTDPVFTERYCGGFPAAGEEPRVVGSPWGDGCLMCVSLTPLFRGHHYKVVATILRLP